MGRARRSIRPDLCFPGVRAALQKRAPRSAGLVVCRGTRFESTIGPLFLGALETIGLQRAHVDPLRTGLSPGSLQPIPILSDRI